MRGSGVVYCEEGRKIFARAVSLVRDALSDNVAPGKHTRDTELQPVPARNFSNSHTVLSCACRSNLKCFLKIESASLFFSVTEPDRAFGCNRFELVPAQLIRILEAISLQAIFDIEDVRLVAVCTRDAHPQVSTILHLHKLAIHCRSQLFLHSLH